jgi:hypothetical protein
MTQDFEQIPSIAALVNNNVTGEPAFTFPEVVEVITLCTANQIAVLGMEIFLIKDKQYYASGCSTYDLQVMRMWPAVQFCDWREYVTENNTLAEESVRSNPKGDEYVYVLTTSSWREFCTIQEARDGETGDRRDVF